MVDTDKLAALKAAILEAEEADEIEKADKLRIERRRLLDADKVAEREIQKEARTIYVEAFQTAIGNVSIPKGTQLTVVIKRTETGFDEMTVALAAIDVQALMGAVHAATGELTVPSTVDGVRFTDGKAELTGRSARATSTGNGGGGGQGHMWQKDGGEAVKLDAAFLEAGGSKDDVIDVKDGTLPFSEGNGSQTWAHKVKTVKASGYSPITVEA